MAYWVKRIVLKTGEIVTERELKTDENLFQGIAPAEGEVLEVICRGRRFEAVVLVGRFPGRPYPAGDQAYPIRVAEI